MFKQIGTTPKMDAASVFLTFLSLTAKMRMHPNTVALDKISA